MLENEYAKNWRQAAPLPSGFINKSRALLRSGILSASSLVHKTLPDTFLRCLYCHYVFDDQKKDFENLIKLLKRTGQFIDTDTCIEMLQGTRKIDQRYYHLSFDDGFKNNYTNALPILIKHNVPAIFFIASAFIEANWEDSKKYCLEITKYSGVIELLSWSDVTSIKSLGYEIGSHTRTHARFSDISHDIHLLSDELLGSKQELESHLNSACNYISWPYGTVYDADAKSLDMVKKAGYKACFGAFRGSITPSTTDVFAIPRHHFEAQWPRRHVRYFAQGNREIALEN